MSSSDKDKFFITKVSILANKIGCNLDSIKRLTGGINNRVYRIGTKNRFAVKCYCKSLESKIDKMESEIVFLKHSQKMAPGITPKIFYVDRENRCVVMEYIDGKKFNRGSIAPKYAINAAIRYLKAINNIESNEVLSLPQASEGYLKLTDHLDNISQRIISLEPDMAPAEVQNGAYNACQKLSSLFDRVTDFIEKKSGWMKLIILSTVMTVLLHQVILAFIMQLSLIKVLNLLILSLLDLMILPRQY